LQAANDLGRVRAKLLNLNAMLSEWNNNVFSDDEFPKILNKFGSSRTVLVEHTYQGSLT